MNDLKIEVVENGFIVYAGGYPTGVRTKSWVFNDAIVLGKFIEGWGLVEEKSK